MAWEPLEVEYNFLIVATSARSRIIFGNFEPSKKLTLIKSKSISNMGVEKYFRIVGRIGLQTLKKNPIRFEVEEDQGDASAEMSTILDWCQSFVVDHEISIVLCCRPP